jgi:hypothetical protein
VNQLAYVHPPGSVVASPRPAGLTVTHRPSDLSIVHREDTGRHDLEHYVHQRYQDIHGADICDFMPDLFALRGNGNELLGVLGFRPAGEGPLFLEAYLDSPIETVLKHRLGTEPKRSVIVEVGNLASSAPGGARWLISLSTALFMGMGLRWAVLTATPALLNSFAKLGIAFVPLAAAAKERIVDADKRWGNYYDAGPVVVASDVSQAFHTLHAQLLKGRRSSGTIFLWERAYRLGLLKDESGLPVVTPLRWVQQA